MKTTTQHSAPGLLNRTELPGTDSRANINFKRRRVNRSLKTERLLALLRKEAPRFFDCAEVVGRWVWIQFESKQPVEVTRVLAELGFHWNKARRAWQHPCGLFRDEAATYDPRHRYGSYFAADNTPA